MATLLECLKSLPPEMLLRDLAATRDPVASVAEHIARLPHDEEGYEVREEPYNYGKSRRKVVGVVGGLTIYRQA